MLIKDTAVAAYMVAVHRASAVDAVASAAADAATSASPGTARQHPIDLVVAAWPQC